MQKLSRRKLLKGTVKTAPLLALASSKSVWASSCMSMSGSLSNNFSNKVTYECNGSAGCTPGFWKNHIQAWPKFLFPGIFLFSNDKFKVAWDWTMGSHDYLDGSKKYYGWSDKSLRKYAKWIIMVATPKLGPHYWKACVRALLLKKHYGNH